MSKKRSKKQRRLARGSAFDLHRDQRTKKDKRLRSPHVQPLPEQSEWIEPKSIKDPTPVIWTELVCPYGKRVYLRPLTTPVTRSPRTGKQYKVYYLCSGDHFDDPPKSMISYTLFGQILAESDKDAINKVERYLATGVRAPFKKRIDWMGAKSDLVEMYVYFDSDLDLMATFSCLEKAKQFAELQNLPELDKNVVGSGWVYDSDRDIWYAGKDGFVSITKTVVDEFHRKDGKLKVDKVAETAEDAFLKKELQEEEERRYGKASRAIKSD